MDDYDDTEYIDEPQFEHGIGAYKQVGFAPVGLGTMDVLGFNKKFDAKGHFKQTVNAIYNQLREDRIGLSGEDLNRLIEIVDILDKVQYKNATGYILGYIASNGGENINKQNLNNVFKNILKTVSDKSVGQEDVLRYARLWLSLARQNIE